MRVSLDVTAVPSQPAGAGRYTIDLATALVARPEIELVLWARRADHARWARVATAGDLGGGGSPPATVRAEAPAPRPLRLVWEQTVLARRLARSGAQVHHGPHYTMPEHSRVPTVVTVHDLTFFDHPEWHERAKVPVFRRAIRRAAARADVLVCVSQHTANRLSVWTEPKGPVFVVPHGIDHARFGPNEPSATPDEQVVATLGVHPPYVLFLGTIEPRKAVPDLVRAFTRMAADNPGLSLVLAGRQGWDADAVEQVIASESLASRVARPGYVPDDAVAPLLRRAAAVVYPAHEEGFGLPALEALACGAPLVTTSGTAMAETTGGAAHLVRAGDVEELAAAMDAVVAGGPEVERRRALGLQVASAYTWERSAFGHIEAYRAAASVGSTGPGGARRGHR